MIECGDDGVFVFVVMIGIGMMMGLGLVEDNFIVVFGWVVMEGIL